jgi:N6-adenosine-specific RNA methylase IME4/DNA-binding CsgD family transcriptional regulator
VKYQVCRPLTPIEFEALKADIAENGVLVPVEVDENGDILDGHHRVQAWRELRDEGVTVPQYAKLIRQGLTEEQKRNHARKLNVLRRQMGKDEREQIMVDMRRDGMSYRQIAGAVGVDASTVLRTVANATVEQPDYVIGKDGKRRDAQQQPRPEPPISLFVPGNESLDVDAAEATVKVVRQERREEVRNERVERINEIAKGNAPMAAARTYPVIYADPPWRYEHSKTVSREIENQYPTMSLEEICALPVMQMAADDAVLFLWTTSPKLEESFAVIPSWGFTYRTCMVWDKERIGMGYYARQQHELLLICTRGNIPVPEPANRPRSVQRIPRDPEHSVKPQEFYQIIEQMYPEYDRVELFARNQREGWAAWGNQAFDSQLPREIELQRTR